MHLLEVDALSVSTVVAVVRGADDIRAMTDVFLSYSREDRERLIPLVEFLETSGFSVFWDRDIRPSSTWRSVIDAELGKARCVVVAWSKQSVKSEWVLEEAESAKADRRLLPVLLDRVDAPLGFRAVQAVDLTWWSRNGESITLQALVDAIRLQLSTADLATSAPPVQVRTSLLESSEKRKKGRLIAGAAAIGAVAATSIWFWSARHKPHTTTPTLAAARQTAAPSGVPSEPAAVALPSAPYRRVYYETFDDRSGVAESVWLLRERGDWLGSLEGGEYRLCNRSGSPTASFASSLLYSEDSGSVDQSDARITMQVRLKPPLSKYSAAGIMFRQSQERGTYSALALSAGHTLMLVVATGVHVKIESTWTLDSIADGDQVELGVEGDGAIVRLFVNKRLIDTLDDQPTTGNAGVFATGRGCFQFDNVAMALPKSTEAGLP